MQYHAKKWFNNDSVNVMAAIAIGAMLVFSVAGMKAFADVVQSNVVETNTHSATVNEGDTVSIKYWISVQGTGVDGQGGCNFGNNLSGGGKSTATIKLTYDTAVLSGPTSVVLTGCNEGNGKTLTFDAIASGEGQVTVSSVSDNDPGSGSYVKDGTTVTITVEEDTPVDTTAPELTLPDDITKEAAGPIEVTYTGVSANDAVDGPVDVTCDPASGSTFPLGTTTVTCTATDAAENTATGSFKVIVQDTTKPELTLPSNPTVEATSAGGAEVTYTGVSANDAVDGSITPECAPASGSTFPLGETTVTCTATDAAGNEATGSFNVIVQDTTPPELTLPSAPPATEATSPQGATVTYGEATATDLVDGSVDVTCDPASGSTFPLGTTTVTCTATDAAGNEATGSFNVIVQDTIKPVIQVTSSISNGQEFYFGDVPTTPTCSATDTASGVNSDGCKVSGYNTAVGSHTLMFTATDNAGNTATQQITYKVLAWTIKGFYQPVDMDTSSTIVINTVKGGSVVPLKLEIFQGTTELTSTTFNNNPVGSFAPKKVSCTPGSTEDSIETLATPGSTVFRYDSTSGQFIYNWQTPKQPNACYDVIFTSLDGTTLTAHFKLK